MRWLTWAALLLAVVGCKKGKSRKQRQYDLGKHAVVAALTELEPVIATDKRSLGPVVVASRRVAAAMHARATAKLPLPDDIEAWSKRWQAHTDALDSYQRGLPEPTPPPDPRAPQPESGEALRAHLEATRQRLVAQLQATIASSRLLTERDALARDLIALARTYQVRVPEGWNNRAIELAVVQQRLVKLAAEAKQALEGDGGLLEMAPR